MFFHYPECYPIFLILRGHQLEISAAMVVAWQVLNKAASPRDARFSKNVLVIAPGLTVKNRLAVLEPAGAGNY